MSELQSDVWNLFCGQMLCLLVGENSPQRNIGCKAGNACQPLGVVARSYLETVLQPSSIKY